VYNSDGDIEPLLLVEANSSDAESCFQALTKHAGTGKLLWVCAGAQSKARFEAVSSWDAMIVREDT
jgi:hypothetical protein